MKNSICFDWFEFSSFIDSPQSLISLLGLSEYEFIETYGSSGYRSGLMFENIFIFFDGRSDMGVHCRMSGQGCRSFEKYSSSNWTDLISNVVVENFKVSRLDVAYDDYKGLIDLEAIIDDVNNRRFVTRFRSDPEVIYKVDSQCNRSYTVNFGRKSSNTFFRIYDKLSERKQKDINVENLNHWVRAEFMFRNDNAFNFLKLLYEGKKIDELYFLWCLIIICALLSVLILILTVGAGSSPPTGNDSVILFFLIVSLSSAVLLMVIIMFSPYQTMLQVKPEQLSTLISKSLEFPT